MCRQDIKSMTLPEISGDFSAQELPSYRAGQVFSWLAKGARDFEEMSNLPASLREVLKKKYYISVANLEKKWNSAYDRTIKYLFTFPDSTAVESVLMEYKHGHSQCISTQAGCRMGCTFCATGMDGLSRNLTAGEMLAQIEAAQRDAGVRVSNLVLMGMGEPLDNYDNVLRFLRLVSEGEGLCIGMRHISLSTCGLVPRIYDLMAEKLQLTLSVSLHAPNDELRSAMMPIGKKYGVDELLTACGDYARVTGRRISFEYAMIDRVNDTDACARELSGKLRGMLCHLNLIPVNAVEGGKFIKSKKERLERFCDIISRAGIPCTVRRTLGADIEASCGQLRRRAQQQGKEGQT